MSATAEKYKIRRHLEAVPDEPERLSEHDALRVLVGATGGAACPFHAVSVLAGHVAGPVAAVPPVSHDLYHDLSGARGLRGSTTVNRLVVEACALRDQNAIGCRYGDPCPDALPMTFLDRRLCQGALARPQSFGAENQQLVQDALDSGDVDRMVLALCPRTSALLSLVDRARAENGGDLPDLVVESAVTLLRTLAGPTKWDTHDGWKRQQDSNRYWTALADQCSRLMAQDFVFDRLVDRVIEGA